MDTFISSSASSYCSSGSAVFFTSTSLSQLDAFFSKSFFFLSSSFSSCSFFFFASLIFLLKFFLYGESSYSDSRSITSLSVIFPSEISSCHNKMALSVKGLSHNPEIIASCPASILFAIAISPSLERRSTVPISRRYNFTGSSVLSPADLVFLSSVLPSKTSSSASESSESIMSKPASDSFVVYCSTCSDVNLSSGKDFLISSWVK